MYCGYQGPGALLPNLGLGIIELFGSSSPDSEPQHFTLEPKPQAYASDPEPKACNKRYTANNHEPSTVAPKA